MSQNKYAFNPTEISRWKIRDGAFAPTPENYAIAVINHIQWGELGEVQTIIELCPDLLNRPLDITFLHQACISKQAEIVEYLVNLKYQLHAQMKNGSTALHIICGPSRSFYDTQILKSLIKGSCFDLADNEGLTGLQVAAMSERKDLLEVMLSSDLYKPVTKDGSAPNPDKIKEWVEKCIQHADEDPDIFAEVVSEYTGRGRLTKVASHEQCELELGVGVEKQKSDSTTHFEGELPSYNKLTNVEVPPITAEETHPPTTNDPSQLVEGCLWGMLGDLDFNNL